MLLSSHVEHFRFMLVAFVLFTSYRVSGSEKDAFEHSLFLIDDDEMGVAI